MDKKLKRRILLRLAAIELPCCKKAFIKALLSMGDINHSLVCDHSARIALLAEQVSKKFKMDTKATFLAGLLHDVGKLVINPELFSGRNINMLEYSEVKRHVDHVFAILGNELLFTAIVSSLHHAMYKNGYGMQLSDCPIKLSPATWGKILDIATLISICDHVEAAMHRTTTQIGSSEKSLRDSLIEKYPAKQLYIDAVLKIARRKKWL